MYVPDGGCCNVAQGLHSFVGNGGGASLPVALNNRALAEYSFIGTGRQQLVDSGASFSSVVGGENNTVNSGYQHSVVGGGCGNTVNGNCSAVLGGSGNTVNHDYAAIFGMGITSVASCAVHANNYVAQNMPVCTSGPFPSGTLSYDPATNIVYRQP